MPSVAQEAKDPPASVQLTGKVRDFKPFDVAGGHVDFENTPENGMARYAGVIAPLIGNDGKPVYGGTGNKITNQWRDSQGRQISYLLYDASQGDVEGSWGQAGTGGITSADSFAQWFRDVPVYNLSAPLTLTLVRQADGMYLFDDAIDPYYAAKGGFYPIDDQLFGNTGAVGNGNGGGPNDHNFHFTFEVHTEFQYDASMGQSFKFEGTDSVWLYIDGQLVNDLIGVHASHDQYVDLDRPSLGLVDGEWYRLDFFFAQRFEPQAHFSISTNVVLDSLPIGTVSAVYD
jgi:fibro-slime domain-containing protein